MNARDERWLRAAIELSARSRAQGHHPFGAILVDADDRVLAQAVNASSADRTAHAEMQAIRAAAHLHGTELAQATLYSSAEPCAMCSGGLYWAGIGRLVYALSEAQLLGITGCDPQNPTMSLPCRDVFARGQRAIEVTGPCLEAEAARVHAGFWQPVAPGHDR